MRKLLLLAGLLAPITLAPAAQAALVKVTMVGSINSDFVFSGDPCGTGSGCTGLPLTIELFVDTALAPNDRDAQANIGSYSWFASEAHLTTFLTGSVTVNGRVFTSISPPTPTLQALPFRQIVILRNDITNLFGTPIDELAIQLDGQAATNGTTVDRRFQLTHSYLLSSATFATPNLSELLTERTILGTSSAVTNAALMRMQNATGDFEARINITSITFELVPEPGVAWMLGAAAVSLCAARRRRS
jgi:hypothetical protein